MRVCDECGGKYFASGKCKKHYRMPSRIPKVGDTFGNVKIIAINKTVSGPIRMTCKVKKQPGVKELLKLAEIVFNRWIRHRDKLTDRTFKCISCGEFKPLREMQAGHFFSKTFSAVRFDEDNLNGECEGCNCHDPKHLKGYEVNLKEKIGLERFNLLLEKYNKPVKWNREELLDLIAKYR